MPPLNTLITNLDRIINRLSLWVLPALVTALFMSVIEVIFTIAFFPAASSDGPGLARFVLEDIALFWMLTLCLATPVALLAEPFLKKNIPTTATLITITLGSIAATLGFFLTLEPFSQGQHMQFPARLELIHYFAIFAVSILVALIFSLIIYPLMVRLSIYLPNLFKSRTVAAIIGLPLVIFIYWTTAFGMFAIHLDVIILATSWSASLIGVVVFRMIVPEINTRKQQIIMISFPLLIAIIVVVPWRAEHSRLVLYKHAPIGSVLAGIIRDALDFDDDGASPTWLGGTDCAAFDTSCGPFEREFPADGIDQNCTGTDGEMITSSKHSTEFALSKCNRALKPNSVIIITVDALRADILSRRVSPNLMVFADQSTVFKRAYSPATFTSYSMAAIFNGTCFGNLASDNFYKDRNICISDSFQKLIQKAGYKTAQINLLGGAAWIYDGFDLVNPSEAQHDPPSQTVLESFVSAQITNDAIDFLNNNKNESIFLWTHYSDLHAPYTDPGDNKFKDGEVHPYERSLAYVDYHVGRLLRYISQTHLAASAFIVVTSDHGEDLGVRGKEGHGPDPFEDATHVPLFFRVPGCTPSVVDTPVSITSVTPSLGKLTGIHMPGRVLKLSSTSTDDPVVVEAIYAEGAYAQMKASRAIIKDRYKLIIDVRNGGRMLFDIIDDTTEQKNIYYSKPQIASKLEAAYIRWNDRPKPNHLKNCHLTNMDPHGSVRIDADIKY